MKYYTNIKLSPTVCPEWYHIVSHTMLLPCRSLAGYWGAGCTAFWLARWARGGVGLGGYVHTMLDLIFSNLVTLQGTSRVAFSLYNSSLFFTTYIHSKYLGSRHHKANKVDV